jgi:hypothetical protein
MLGKKWFDDPIEVKEKKSSLTFAAPTKEQATTGRFMPGGDNYGVGRRSPVGRLGNPKKDAKTLPREPKCFELS